MHDTIPPRPDHQCLFWTAASQHGYFTAAQARACGLSWDLLSQGARRGKYIRARRGLYRLRDYPSGTHEHVAVAWLAAGKDSAAVSHESALDLYELSDVIPNAIHLTIPRSRRFLALGPDIVLHTTTRPLARDEVWKRDGMRVTSPTRSILDSAELGTGPEQIEMAIGQALSRGLTTEEFITAAARSRTPRVRRLVEGALRQRRK